jgi:hypothetical protein
MCKCTKTQKPKGTITEAKTILRKMWENTQLQEKPTTVTKINKS